MSPKELKMTKIGEYDSIPKFFKTLSATRRLAQLERAQLRIRDEPRQSRQRSVVDDIVALIMDSDCIGCSEVNRADAWVLG